MAGWEPYAPPEDTLLRAFVTCWTTFNETISSATGGVCLRRDDLVATNLGRPADFFNQVTFLAPLLPSRLDGLMEELTNFYRGVDAGDVYMFSPWPSPDLRPYGWHLKGHPPLMLRPAGNAPQRPSSLIIEEVRTAEELELFQELIIRGFPLEALEPSPAGTFMDISTLQDDRLRCWIGYRDDQPVSASSMFGHSGINNVTLVATLPDARGHGFGEALAWQATCADSKLPAMLISSDLGRPVYERMGYLPLLRLTVWTRPFTG